MEESKESGFVKLLQENKAILVRISRVYTSNKYEREDLEQEIVYQLWKSIDTFSGKSKLTTWVYRVALNTALKHKKSISNTVQTRITDYKIKPVQEEQTDDKLQELYDAIQKLNDIERRIVTLYLSNMSYKSIGQATGFTETNIGTKMNRIRKKLKRLLRRNN